jgi:hypothetical protein
MKLTHKYYYIRAPIFREINYQINLGYKSIKADGIGRILGIFKIGISSMHYYNFVVLIQSNIMIIKLWFGIVE